MTVMDVTGEPHPDASDQKTTTRADDPQYLTAQQQR